MAPETHTRYRVQRLIRLGEWLEDNRDMLITCIDAIDDVHNHLMDAEDNYQDACEYAVMRMMNPLVAAQRKMLELRRNQMCDDVRNGQDVTIYQRYADADNRYQVVIPAPQPKGIPTQEEFDRVRSQVDITN